MSSTPGNTYTNSEYSDYEQSKKDFLKLARSCEPQELYQIHNKTKIDQIIAQKLEHPLLHPKYNVIQRDGKNILVMKTSRRIISGCYVRILSWEDMFDMFMPLHVRSGHRGVDTMKNEIRLLSKKLDIKFSFPQICLPYFRRACAVCVQYNDRFSLMKGSKVGVVHVIAMAPSRHDERFRYLLIYADKETNYTILRPITAKTNLEISTELFKIFTQFGPPMRLQIHGYNSMLTEKIGSTLNDICPGFKIITEHMPSQYALPAIVTDRIQEWMSASKSLVWEVGCCMVQAAMNNDPSMRPSGIADQPGCTPHALYFHTISTAPKTDNSAIDLPAQSTNQNLTTERIDTNEMDQETSVWQATTESREADQDYGVIDLLSDDDVQVVECDESDNDSTDSESPD